MLPANFHLHEHVIVIIQLLSRHTQINHRGVFTFVRIIHLYSWIAAGAIQVTTHPFKVADLHLTILNPHLTAVVFDTKHTLEWGLVYVIASIWTSLGCLSQTNILKTNVWIGINFAVQIVVYKRMKHIDHGDLHDLSSSTIIKLTF